MQISHAKRAKNNFYALFRSTVHPAFDHEIQDNLKASFKIKFKQTDKMSLHRSRPCLRLLSFQLPPLRQASYLYAWVRGIQHLGEFSLY